MRLIDGDKLYQALHEAGGCDASKGSWADGWDKAIDEAIRIVAEAPTIEIYGTWISCSERLPEDSRDVILTTRSSVVGVGCFTASDGKWVQWYSGGGILVDVIAWMPLPEPYREE